MNSTDTGESRETPWSNLAGTGHLLVILLLIAIVALPIFIIIYTSAIKADWAHERVRVAMIYADPASDRSDLPRKIGYGEIISAPKQGSPELRIQGLDPRQCREFLEKMQATLKVPVDTLMGDQFVPAKDRDARGMACLYDSGTLVFRVPPEAYPTVATVVANERIKQALKNGKDQ